jgi:hypothetical protein
MSNRGILFFSNAGKTDKISFRVDKWRSGVDKQVFGWINPPPGWLFHIFGWINQNSPKPSRER